MLEQIVRKTNRRDRTSKEENDIERKREKNRRRREEEWKKKRKKNVEIEDREKIEGQKK